MPLFMLKIGGRPDGRLIEQHDVMFLVANQLRDVIPMVNATWTAVKNSWHLDAWRMVNRVGDYQIKVTQNSLSNNNLLETHPVTHEAINEQCTTDSLSSPKLFFVNLGGYLPNQFEEFHYKTLVVAETVGKATAQVKKSDFYRDYTFDNINPASDGVATSHVDDKHEVVIDDIHCVADLLPDGLCLDISPLSDEQKMTIPDDTLHIGYLSLKQLRALAHQNLV